MRLMPLGGLQRQQAIGQRRDQEKVVWALSLLIIWYLEAVFINTVYNLGRKIFHLLGQL